MYTFPQHVQKARRWHALEDDDNNGDMPWSIVFGAICCSVTFSMIYITFIIYSNFYHIMHTLKISCLLLNHPHQARGWSAMITVIYHYSRSLWPTLTVFQLFAVIPFSFYRYVDAPWYVMCTHVLLFIIYHFCLASLLPHVFCPWPHFHGSLKISKLINNNSPSL